MASDQRRNTVAGLNLVYGLASLGLGTWFLVDPLWSWPAGMDQRLPQGLFMLAGFWLAVHLCITLAYWRRWRGSTGLMAGASAVALLAWPLGTAIGLLTLGLLLWPAAVVRPPVERTPTAR